MVTRITSRGQVTIPKQVREALRLSPGDRVDFTANAQGEVVFSKKTAQAPRVQRAHPVHPRVEAQMRRRAAELLALLRGLD